MTDAQIPSEDFLVLINDMLATGEIPDLFPDDEIENIIAGVRNEVKGAGLVDTRENCWKFFIDRVRKQLKIVLCFSPVGSTLRVRSRKFPAIINATSINWFHEWPQEALISVAKPKWIVLDGDIDPMWIESLNTVMDDNKVLTLASNERIALTPSMRLLFEISNLRTATPATVSRAGILYINPQDLGWNP